MNTRITLHPSLDPDWNTRLQRQINLSLATLDRQISNFHAKLLTLPEQQTHHLIYSCELKAILHDGKKKSVVTRGRDPLVCIMDAAERMRRNVTREARLGSS